MRGVNRVNKVWSDVRVGLCNILSLPAIPKNLFNTSTGMVFQQCLSMSSYTWSNFGAMQLSCINFASMVDEKDQQGAFQLLKCIRMIFAWLEELQNAADCCRCAAKDFSTGASINLSCLTTYITYFLWRVQRSVLVCTAFVLIGALS